MVRAFVDAHPGEPVRRGGAEQPGDPLHPGRRRRARRAGVRRDARQVSAGALHRARGMAGRLVGVPQAAVHRHGAHLRARGGGLPALRLPAAVAVLDRARPRSARQRAHRHRTLSACRHRLPEQLLRPAGVAGAPGPQRSQRQCARRPHRRAAAATAERAADRAAPRPRAVPGRRRRGALRAARLRRLAGAAGDARPGAEPLRQPAHRNQRHEAGLSAVPRRRRREAAGRGPQGALPGGLLAAPAAAGDAARARSLRGGGARRPGVDLRSGDRVVGQGHRPDAGDAGHRPPVRRSGSGSSRSRRHG